MKFDVVLGNPPYQNSQADSGNYALWPHFIRKANDLLLPTGIMSMVVPQTWAANRKTVTPHAKSTTAIRADVLSTGHLSVANFNIKYYFINVASTFSYFVWHKIKQSTPTTVVTPNGTYTTDYDSVDWLKIRLEVTPEPPHPELKLINDGREDTRFRSGVEGIGSGTYRIANTSAQYTKGKYLLSKRPHPHQFTPKVIFSNSGYPAPFYDNGQLGLGHHARAFQVESEEEAAEVIEFLTSDYLIDLANTIPDSGATSHLGKLLSVGYFDK